MLERENALRIAHKCCIGGCVLLVLSSNEMALKLDATTEEPFQVTVVSRNGTMKILRDRYKEKANILQLRLNVEPETSNL